MDPPSTLRKRRAKWGASVAMKASAKKASAMAFAGFNERNSIAEALDSASIAPACHRCWCCSCLVARSFDQYVHAGLKYISLIRRPAANGVPPV